MGALAVPRPTAWIFAMDKWALKRDLLDLAQLEGLARVISGRVEVAEDNAASRLRKAAKRLG